jgi:hypothetical protein
LPVRTVSKAVLLGSLEAFLCKVAMENKRALLIVDEAQNLTTRAVEELRMLSNFQLGSHALLQSFLIGQPELRTMMQSPEMQQLRQRVTASYHLGPLDREETKAYIEHRLHHVGWSGDPEFEPECFDLIHSLTTGIPRRINTLCNRLMLGAYLAERHKLGGADIQAIAREINEELGTDATLTLAPVADAEVPEAAPPVVLTGDALIWRRHFENIEQRIDRLDKTIGAAVDLIHGMLHPDKVNKPNTPAGR